MSTTKTLNPTTYERCKRIMVVLILFLLLMVIATVTVVHFISSHRESKRVNGEYWRRSEYSRSLGSDFSRETRFGTGNYECSGSCYCVEEGESEFRERRTTVSLKTGLIFSVSALSTMMAIGFAKNAFNKECKDQFLEECPVYLIESEVECNEAAEIKEEEEETTSSMKEKFEIEAIGIIHTPYKKRKGMPVAQVGAKTDGAVIAIFPEYVPAIQDLEGFSHVYVTFLFHQIQETLLKVVPALFDKDEERGIFSTRSPLRPNRIGLSLCRIIKVVGNEIHVDGIDAMDGTPVVDLKPYLPQFETDMSKEDVDTGWFDATKDVVKKKRFRHVRSKIGFGMAEDKGYMIYAISAGFGLFCVGCCCSLIASPIAVWVATSLIVYNTPVGELLNNMDEKRLGL